MRRKVAAELKWAKELHPIWPKDQVHQVAIVCEEAGEALQAALNHVDHGKDFCEITKEIIQTAAMCERWLEENEHIA